MWTCISQNFKDRRARGESLLADWTIGGKVVRRVDVTLIDFIFWNKLVDIDDHPLIRSPHPRERSVGGSSRLSVLANSTMRDCSNQLDVPSYVGEVWDSPDFPFPIYKPDTMIVVEGHDVWTPTCEAVDKLKKKRA